MNKTKTKFNFKLITYLLVSIMILTAVFSILSKSNKKTVSSTKVKTIQENLNNLSDRVDDLGLIISNQENVTFSSTLLWENENTNNQFEAQTIQLDLSEFKYVLIRYGFFRGEVAGMFNVIAKVGEEAILNAYAGTGGDCGNMYFYKRSVLVNQNSVVFGNAILGYNTVNVSNSGCIPFEIYGINF